MPRRQRQAKRRASPEAELEAWGMAFLSGHDFLGDLAPWGFPPGPDGTPAVRAAAGDAWARLGRMYLDRLDRHVYPDAPWAQKQFGEPKTCP